MTYVAQTWCGARRMRKCVRTHKLPLLCCLFGFFWCSLAVLMICQYMRMALSETRQHGKVTGHRSRVGCPLDFRSNCFFFFLLILITFKKFSYCTPIIIFTCLSSLCLHSKTVVTLLDINTYNECLLHVSLLFFFLLRLLLPFLYNWWFNMTDLFLFLSLPVFQGSSPPPHF